jgi:hypothetical protein
MAGTVSDSREGESCHEAGNRSNGGVGMAMCTQAPRDLEPKPLHGRAGMRRAIATLALVAVLEGRGMGTQHNAKRRDRPPVEARVCRAIRLLAEGRSAGDVAQIVRVRPETLAAWQADPDFRALVACMTESGQMAAALDALNDLTSEAILALHKALSGDDVRVAVQAAREVLDRVGLIRRKGVVAEGSITEMSEQVVRVEYVNRDGQAVSTTPWADRHSASPGTVQGGGVRAALREDGDGQDSDD